MALTEFLEKIGNENLAIQVLHDSVVLEKKTKHDLEITFATELALLCGWMLINMRKQ